ncbi:MAG TPA: sodium ion-translocating decarboxylase subunit beta [Candidatus Pygmaiobacter gallistercoris]|nr:sodium ion-translocating decarboxylase subunit beta [Candidatus Pygmaiobacter gallistercoris]
MQGFLDAVVGIAQESGFAGLIADWRYLVMIVIACVLLYLAIVKQFEPLLLLPIAFGMLLANLPGSGIIHMEYFLTESGHPDFLNVLNNGGLADMLYLGVKLGVYPPLIFLGIGSMTDFGPLISNPKSLLLGAAAQLGIFMTYFGAKMLGFTGAEAASIGIIGGADGPTAIYVTSKLAPHLLGAIAVAAYSYMALVPVIQPPIMRALTTKKERRVKMTQLRPVSKTEKVIFPIMCTIVIALLLPSAAPLVGMLMLGNLMKESGVVERICKTAGNELMNIITIFLGFSVGCTTSANTFLNAKTLYILALGVIAFGFGTAGGVLLGKLMCWATHGKVNPLIGSAGVSAVPMAARVSQKEGQKEDPSNFLLMHAMGPNVAGVIGSAVAAGILINMLS